MQEQIMCIDKVVCGGVWEGEKPVASDAARLPRERLGMRGNPRQIRATKVRQWEKKKPRNSMFTGLSGVFRGAQKRNLSPCIIS
jgi:hypothetical protein